MVDVSPLPRAPDHALPRAADPAAERARMAPPRGASRSLRLAVAGGALLGIANFGPWAWPFAWLGIAATAAALTVEPARWRAVLGLLLGGGLTRVLWLAWSPAMARAMAPDDLPMQVLVGGGLVLIAALPVVAALCLGALVLPQARRWVPVWVPVAWVVGERLQARWTSVATDWLFTQVDASPVMRALGLLGLIPTTLLCLFAAASAGQALALRQRWRLAPAGGILCGLLLAPPLDAGDLSQLEGVGAVHMASETTLPAVDQVDLDLRLVVWPEVAIAFEPPVAEGPVSATGLDDPPGGPQTWHLIGAKSPARYGQQNLALAVSPTGAITQARAKSSLLPVFERPFLGVGGQGFVPGQAPPVLTVGGRTVIPLICGEQLDRRLVAAGAAAGGTLITVLARDLFQGGSALADRHVLKVLRLRAIEFGLPAVYASLGGRASLVSASGQVLARSAADALSGVLTWSAARGAEDRVPRLAPTVTVLYDPRTPWLRPDCRPGRCAFQPLDPGLCERARAGLDPVATRTVVISGHADAEVIAGLTPARLAEQIACLDPALVVLDTCFGASAPTLAALAARSDALVVAVPAFVAGRGLRYDPDFYTAAQPEARAAAVRTHPPAPLYVGRPDAAALARASAWVAEASGDTLRPRVRSWVPTLVGVALPSGQEILVPADWRKIGHPPEALTGQPAAPGP